MRPRHIAQFTARSFAGIVCCVALTSLCACQPHGPDAPIAKYLGKLRAALAVTAPDPPPDAPPRPPLTSPGTTALQIAIPASRIDSLDFLQLSGCAVQANIGKRQISLGQLAKPSQRLLLELEYLRLAPACISRLRTGNISGNVGGNFSGNNPALADVLEAAWREKQAQLPALIFNATLGGDEYRAFWLATPTPGDYPRGSPDDVAAAMRALNDQTRRWLSGDYGAHNRNVELLLSAVAGGDGGAQLQAWTLQIDWLVAADRLLEDAGVQWCSRHSDHTEARSRMSGASTYFTATILPLATQSRQRYQMAVAPAMALEAQLNTILPALYREWMEDRNQRVATLANTPARHLEGLQHLPQTCAAAVAR